MSPISEYRPPGTAVRPSPRSVHSAAAARCAPPAWQHTDRRCQSNKSPHPPPAPAPALRPPCSASGYRRRPTPPAAPCARGWLLHLGHAVINRVQQRRPVPAAHRRQPRLDILHRIGKSSISSGRSLNPITKNSSCGIGRLDELQNRFPRPHQLRRHRARKVEDDPDRDRRILAAKLRIFCSPLFS